MIPSILIIILISITISTLLYLYIRKKTGIRTRFIFIDNPIVFSLSILTGIIFYYTVFHQHLFPSVLAAFILIPVFTIILTMIRFWRTPYRECDANESDIISPADGKIIYIKKLTEKEEPISVKNGKISRLTELTKTDLLTSPCWLIGINMTPFDVHKNSAPASGKIILSKHFNGRFLSLKNILSESENERHTIVIQQNNFCIGITQIASRLVRRIDTYIKEGDYIERGDWYGMIRFGSQVDIIFPDNFKPDIRLFQQVYAGKTTIAKIENEASD
jgi:phosphatidylserine decarboxylase